MFKLFIGLIPQIMMDADTGGGSGATGVDNSAAAGQESNVDNQPAGGETLSGSSAESGVENNPPEGGGEGPAAGDQSTNKPDDKTEVAFAKRLAAERTKLEQQIRQETDQQYLSKYAPLLDLAEFEATKHGMDPIEWAKAVQANRVQTYEDNLRHQAEEMGIAPAALKMLVEQHPDVVGGRRAQQQVERQQETIRTQSQHQERVQKDVNEFVAAYPKVTMNDIPPEVFELAEKGEISLLDAYNRVVLPKKLTELQQAMEVKKKNQENANSNPGSVTGGGNIPAGFFTKEQVERMSQADVRKNLDAILASQKQWK